MIEIRNLIHDLGETHTVILSSHIPVSYTHLDVYKRQRRCCAAAVGAVLKP